jgi:hypothetical protein
MFLLSLIPLRISIFVETRTKSFAIDIYGIISPSSNLLSKRIASAYAILSNRPQYNYALNICKRRVSFAIKEGLAR